MNSYWLALLNMRQAIIDNSVNPEIPASLLVPLNQMYLSNFYLEEQYYDYDTYNITALLARIELLDIDISCTKEQYQLLKEYAPILTDWHIELCMFKNLDISMEDVIKVFNLYADIFNMSSEKIEL